MSLSDAERRRRIAHYDALAPDRARWRGKNRYYHRQVERLCRSLIPPGRRILQVGCGTGDLLHALRPSVGVGLDFSPAMARTARARFPHLRFLCGDAERLPLTGPFDVILLSDVIGDLEDVWAAFRQLRRVAHPQTRIIITYYNFLWEPLLKLGEAIGRKMPQPAQNWLSLADMENLLLQNGFEPVHRGWRLLLPVGIPGLAWLCNQWLARLPLLRRASLVEFLVARPQGGDRPPEPPADSTVSVIVPCRNERGHVAGLAERIPALGAHTEILFVDGASTDGTVEAIEEQIEKYKGKKEIRLIHQVDPPPSPGAAAADPALGDPSRMLKLGKGDAVRKGFAAARGEVLMILDADLSVPPEDLPKFYTVLREGTGELVMGSRLIYQMEEQAMRLLNIFGNKLFSLIFSFLLEQRIKDTLCGTKVLWRRDYEAIAANRAHFGDFDPFGDFDLILGAARLNLKITEIPIRYRERIYGVPKIRRFQHGLLLLRMSLIALRKLKLS